MHLSNSVKKATVTILVLLMAAILLVAVPIQPAEAQLSATQPYSGPVHSGDTFDVAIAAKVRMSFTPNPIGVGQPLLVNIWVVPAPAPDRMQRDYKVTITKPDGTQDVLTMDSLVDDGTQWFQYVPDQIGVWKLKFDFPGTYFPVGYYSEGYIVTNKTGTVYTESAYYKPSSTPEQELVVQQDQIMSWPPSALPTNYWTRPVYAQNREWWPIAGNYPCWGVGGGPLWDELYPNTNIYPNSRYAFTPWVQAPNTAHVVWRRQIGSTKGAGIAGGENGIGSFNPENSARDAIPDIILAGRCYQIVTKPMMQLINGSYQSVPTSVWECYDLRTGKVYWDLTGISQTPTAISYTKGASAMANLAAELVYIGSGRLVKYDAWTGAVLANISISPLTTGTYYLNQYALSVQTINATAGNYRLINWTTTGTGNLASRIMNNISWPWSSLPTTYDLKVGIAASVSGIAISKSNYGINVKAASLTTGAQLWNITVLDQPLFSGSAVIADHGKIAALTENGYWLAWDLLSGKLAWQSETMDYPWDASGWGVYDAQSAYGFMFWESMTGVYAHDWETGKRVWKFNDPAPAFETPYGGNYSMRNHAVIADGKLYVAGSEHSPTQPVTRGWKLYCINATTGEGIWNVTGAGVTSAGPGPIADGYLTFADSYDGYTYIFGKGKSTTTVSTPVNTVPMKTAVLIQGTVMDMSPGDQGTVANPTAPLDSLTAQGTVPCVSAASMRTQMDYLYMQYPIDGLYHNVTLIGVPVSLSAMSPNGTSYDLGTVMTNGYYGTFSLAWNPPKEDTFTIIASFAGDDSYGSSSASTAVVVGPAPASIDTGQQQITVLDYTMTILGVGIAVILAVAIAAVAIILMLRKR